MTMRYIGKDGHHAMRASARLAAACVMAAMLVVLSGCGNVHTFRYRLTVEVEDNGEVKSASSIIEVQFRGGGQSSSGSPYRYYTSVKGVAPVIDLGRGGMLVAALTENGEEYYRRKRKYNLACKGFKNADTLPDAFRLEASKLVKLREGKRELADGGYPAFIWFPDGETYEKAQQLCPEEFAEAIDGHVVLRSVSIEIAPDAPLLTHLEIQPQWLPEMQRDSAAGRASYAGIYRANITYIETFIEKGKH